MRLKLPSIAAIAATLSLLPVTGCELDVPDLNNPSIDDLEENPTEASVTAAATGLLIGNRRNRAQANGYVAQLGILGREAYNFDQADPRFIGELLKGPLQQGSPFGGNFWAGPYANIRLANLIQQAVERVPEFSPEEMAAIRGFSKTIEATDLLEVAVTRDTIGGVIDTDRELGAGLGAIVTKEAMLTEIAKLLDDGAMDLANGGAAFPFELSSGYQGFSTPMSFAQFNRAIRARVAAYMKDYPTVLTALGASFIDATVTTVDELQAGVYHSYSTASGDAVNNLINPNLFAHPSFRGDAMANDARVTRKSRIVAETEDDPAGSAQGLMSKIKYTLYTSPDSRVPIIRNEELLLLRAEARFFTGDAVGATMDLNLVRTVSGGLPAIAEPANQDAFIDALLYERRYSLAFEGHRWIDVRRFDRVMTLPLDMPDHVRNLRFPIPTAECDARPGEPACALGSMPNPQ